ncbi:prepilin-type N-terminal cleavage/methylation domain-containing protein [Polynucleobacter sp.]|uniref:type IV pilus modification PilV family protein n=1 Tax=Polynucleobacter sp. TaxID=2029855 RepID=UPI00273254CB|nr:prepilin-type N-terminal cleavage/methylation domain-containing protein [Polynucleobacter sp.]
MQKPYASRFHPSIPTSHTAHLVDDRGFGLIEVVVAMALVAGTYISVVEAYQRVLLRYGQIEVRRTELNRAQDQHERGSP